MRRLIPVISFLILASTAFWGILQYAKIQEDLKKQTSVKTQTIKICTDLQSNILDEIGKEFYAETGFQIEIIRMTAEQLGSNGHQGIGEADIFLTSQTNLEELKKNKALRSYSSESTDTALEQFKDFEGTWTGIWLDPIVFVVNKEFAARHSLLNYNWNNIMTSPQIRLWQIWRKICCYLWQNTSGLQRHFTFCLRGTPILYNMGNIFRRHQGWQVWENVISGYPAIMRLCGHKKKIFLYKLCTLRMELPGICMV